MPNIGIILSGCASKVTYEIGCMRAIEDYFGRDSIKCVSSASLGALAAHLFGADKIDSFERVWKGIDSKEHGRFVLKFTNDDVIFSQICDAIGDDVTTSFEHYVCVWNYTQRKVEYIPFHTLSADGLKTYLRGAISVPLVCKGEIINGDKILDGAFVDNIPAYPLLDKDLDYIFCVYFDNARYFFENEEFNQKVIKLFDFPNEKRMEVVTFKPDNFDGMVEYAYDYTTRMIKRIFENEDYESPYDAITALDKDESATYKHRLTADVVLTNITSVTKRFARRLSNITKQSD